jgi:FKBP-type peptidyl-prolyl cis-trans isomerase
MKLTSLFLVAAFILAACSLISADTASYQKRTAKKFFDSIKARNPNVVELKNGMLVEWLAKGDGETSPKEGTSCSMHYHGQLKTGEVFDSSIDRNSPISFAPNQVIKSWTEVMSYMIPGDEIRIFSPSELAYGARGSPPKIPPHSPLVFKMKMLKVEGKDGKPAAEARKLLKENTVDGKGIDEIQLTTEQDYKP